MAADNPYRVTIRRDSSVLGGGFLIGPRHALTAALPGLDLAAPVVLSTGGQDAPATVADVNASENRTPTARDWARLSRSWRPMLDERIAQLERLRDQLDSCIGCGCLSLATCGLYNRGDEAAALGPGARWLIGERPARG